MTDQRTNPPGALGAVASVASGGLLFASGLMTTLLAIPALFTNQLFLESPAWILRLNFGVWGWIHLALGVLMVLGAVALIFRWGWTPAAATVSASTSMVLLFLWVPYSTAWSVVIIAPVALAIWAIRTWESPACETTTGMSSVDRDAHRRRGQ